ncbi:MAG: serine protease [Candidatus Eremiobacteraeota bacterium]|nr:serine protease [Candidatus Eremiobacteraeota bacterium]
MTIIRLLEKTVVFLGRTSESGRRQFEATGFLISVNDILHLATAKHVIFNMETGEPLDKGLQVFFNLKSRKIGSRSVDKLKKELDVKWIVHEKPEVDVAVLPFTLIPSKEDVAVVDDEMFLPHSKLSELYDVFYLSYQPGLEERRKISPVVRGGQISLIDPDKTFYMDGFAFPGNSGSPVFLKPSRWRFKGENAVLGRDELGFKFAGIIGEYLPYQEIAVSAQTGRPRVVFEENTGLSKVWSGAFIQEIIKSKEFQQQCRKFKEA